MNDFESVFFDFLAFSAVGLLIWAVYYFSGMHRHFIQNDSDYKRIFLPLVGVVAIGWAVVSIITGESSLGQTYPVLRDIDPRSFWAHVVLKVGAGIMLIVIGLLYPARRT